jgi:chemotaxis family two-component system response regulator Rcp1
MPHAPHAVPDILVVEDEPAEVSLLREAFASGPTSVHVHSVPSVAHALAFLRHAAPYGHAPRPHLIVTSLNLPRRPGFELLAELQHDPALRSIPVIVVSQYDEPAVIQQSYALGAKGYLIKGGELDAFFGAVHTMVAEWLP